MLFYMFYSLLVTEKIILVNIVSTAECKKGSRGSKSRLSILLFVPFPWRETKFITRQVKVQIG